MNHLMPAINLPKFALRSAALALIAFIPSAFALSDSWISTVSGSWATAGNWSSGTVPGSTSIDNTDVATFGVALAANRTVTVDANRYIGGISFANSGTFAYTLATGTLHLNSGGVIQTLSVNGNHTDVISAPIVIDGNGGSAFFTALATSASSLMNISGTVSGVSTVGNATTLTLNGTNLGSNTVTGIITNGTSGGQLALVKSDSGTWTLGFSAANTFTGGTTIKGG